MTAVATPLQALPELRTTRTIEALPDPDGCSCSTWADGIELTYDTP